MQNALISHKPPRAARALLTRARTEMHDTGTVSIETRADLRMAGVDSMCLETYLIEITGS